MYQLPHLLELRLESNRSIDEVARAIGRSPDFYVRLEQGLARGRFRDLIELALLFGVSTDYLLGRSDRRETSH